MVNWRAKGYRLPTEAEWEKASRGGVAGFKYSTGNLADASNAFFNQTKSDYTAIQSVGKYSPNGYGLYDMAGNVWEACWDWYWSEWYGQPEASIADPIGPVATRISAEGKTYRVVRGGDGEAKLEQLESAYRKDINKTWAQYAIGLRPVVPAHSQRNAMVTLRVDPPFLGSAVGGGVYPIDSSAQMHALHMEEGVNFLHWQDEDGNNLGASPTIDVLVRGDIVITAVIEDARNLPISYRALQATADIPGTGHVTGGGIYLDNSLVTLEAIPARGLSFIGWSGDVAGTTTPMTITLNDDSIARAHFGDNSEDSDHDSLSDSYEKALGTNPFDSDTDLDGLSDGDEVNSYGSNPTLLDSDGDTYDDKTEVAHNSNPSDPTDIPFIPEVNLLLYLPFDGKAEDLSGNNPTTAKSTSVAKDRADLNKKALAFDGEEPT